MSNAFEIMGDVPAATTAIEFILDETGSMMSVWDQTIAGFNEYVNSQKLQSGNCLLSLTKFDSNGVNNVYTDSDIQTVQFLDRNSYRPGCSTNLYDAVGFRVKALEQRIASFPENTSCLIVIMTDGFDNASVEYTSDNLKTLIGEKEKQGWTFVFLGANQDAWAVGQTFGMSKGNTMTYDAANISGAMGDLAAATTSYRGLRSKGVATASCAVNDFFSSMPATDTDTKE